jgi:CheY-like chemotaxis protein
LSAKASSTRIVIAADDNPHNLQLLEAILESQGYTFFGVPSGEECLALAARIVPRLFILDIDMPEMDGFETCRRLRANPATRDIPVAFFTAHHRDADLREGLAAGGNDFLLKPIDPVKLLARVRRWTEGRLAKPAFDQALAELGETPAKRGVVWL